MCNYYICLYKQSSFLTWLTQVTKQNNTISGRLKVNFIKLNKNLRMYPEEIRILRQ